MDVEADIALHTAVCRGPWRKATHAADGSKSTSAKDSQQLYSKSELRKAGVHKSTKKVQ